MWPGRPATVVVLAWVIAFAAPAFSGCRGEQESGSTESSTGLPGLLDRIDATGEIHAAYGVYPPYTQEDPNTKAVSGFCVDVLNEIAEQLKVKVVWHRMNWNTMAADLQRGDFDVIADAIFQTVPRAREYSFTEPYTYFADGIAVVRKGETRFATFESLDDKSITISVGLGWASETLVRARLSSPKVLTVQTTTDLLQVFNEVMAGRADAAIVDGADARRFVAEHPDEFEALWLDAPPAYMPAGFALRLDDRTGTEFLNVSLRNLRATGILKALANKHKIPSSDVPFPG